MHCVKMNRQTLLADRSPCKVNKGLHIVNESSDASGRSIFLPDHQELGVKQIV